MAGKIDKTRPEFTGLRSFIGSGVGTVRDLLEEQQDPRQMIQDMINEALSNVVGAVTIQDVPDQVTYNFAGGGITQSQLDNAISNLRIEMWDMYDDLIIRMMSFFQQTNRWALNIQQQINNLESGSAALPNILVSIEPRKDDMTTGVSTQLDFNSIIYDPDGLADTDNNWIVIPETGNYLVLAHLYFANGSSGNHPYQALIKQDSTWLAVFNAMFVTIQGSVHCADIVHLTKDDKITVFGTQSSGDLADCQGQYFTVTKMA